VISYYESHAPKTWTKMDPSARDLRYHNFTPYQGIETNRHTLCAKLAHKNAANKRKRLKIRIKITAHEYSTLRNQGRCKIIGNFTPSWVPSRFAIYMYIGLNLSYHFVQESLTKVQIVLCQHGDRVSIYIIAQFAIHLLMAVLDFNCHFRI